MEWRAATIDEVSKIVDGDLIGCGEKEAAAFARYRVAPYAAPLYRYGKDERVVVVARRLDEVIYWEDVEEGFNRSPVDGDGRIAGETTFKERGALRSVRPSGSDQEYLEPVDLSPS